VKLSLSTLQRAVRLQGEMTSSFGNYTVDTWITAAGDTFQQSLNVTGANLPVQAGASFKLLEFTFSKNFSYPASGCASFDVGITGSMKMGNKAYRLLDGKFAMACSKVTQFRSCALLDALSFAPMTTPRRVMSGDRRSPL
jgi:hypothetical protein